MRFTPQIKVEGQHVLDEAVYVNPRAVADAIARALGSRRPQRVGPVAYQRVRLNWVKPPCASPRA